MKKPIKNLLVSFLLPVLFIHLAYGTEYNKQNDWKEYDLKGKVKSYTKIKYTAKEIAGKIIKDKKLCLPNDCESLFFDSNGNLLEKISYNESNQPVFEDYYQYDGNNHKEVERHYIDGNINREILYHYDTTGNNIQKTEYLNGKFFTKTTQKYDNNHNQIEQNTYNNDGSLSYRYIYTYHPNNNMIKKSIYKNNGSLESKETYLYDENGNKIEEKLINEIDKNKNYKITYAYNTDGKQIKLIKYNADDSIEYKAINKYDRTGNNVEQTHYTKTELSADENESYSLTYRKISQYDNKGNLIKETYYHNRFNTHITEDGSSSYYTYKYDTKGNNIVRFYMNKKGGNSQKLIYQYDNKGNKVRSIEYENGVVKYIIETEYRYF